MLNNVVELEAPLKGKKVRVFVENGDTSIMEVVYSLGWRVVGVLAEADMIMLQGGADISPSWYNAHAHPQTHWNDGRDRVTASLINYALENKLPIVGICRGAQMLNAIFGGSMYQHVDKHAGNGNHLVVDLMTGQEWMVNSLHHQMMIPHESAEIVAVAKGPVSTVRERTTDSGTISYEVTKADSVEVEALWYKEFDALCFQAHPEYVGRNQPTRIYFNELLERYYPQFFN